MKLLTLPLIVVVCYFSGELIKIFFNKQTKIKKAIPFFMGITGMILGILIYLTNKELLHTTNIWDSMLVGAISGLCATGTNEVIKINNKFKGEIYDNTKSKNIT